MKKIILSIIVTCLFFNLKAQEEVPIKTISLSGKVFDCSTDNHEEIPFANIVLLSASDTTYIVQGSTTDLQGNYHFESLKKDNYILKASYIGYKPFEMQLNLKSVREKKVIRNVSLQQEPVALNEIVIKGKRSIRGIDKTTFSFSEQQIKKAREGRDLLADLPNLHIDKSKNSLSTIDGKSVIILINGIKATDTDLKLIPADKIKNVEYYDVPPIRYMDNAEVVVNVRTKDLNSGWSGDFYAIGGQMFSGGSTALSRVKGDHKFTLFYDLHVNMKRNVRSWERGGYEYKLEDTPYHYIYEKESKDWGKQNLVGFTYLNSKEEDYSLQIKGTFAANKKNSDADKNILLSINQQVEERNGLLTDKIQTLSPTLDIYFSKQLSKNSSLAFDLLGTYFDNEQRTYSFESGANGFEDDMILDNQKKSLIGELIYTHRINKVELTAGYRGNFNFLSNELSNSLADDQSEEEIRTQKHYFYGEVTGRIKSFMYRASLGGNCDIKSGNDGFRNLTFTPLFLIGYNINQDHNIRLSFQSSTTMPDIQQMSDARILIMDHFYKTGNKELENAHNLLWELTYGYTGKRLSLKTNLFYENNKDGLYDSYGYDDNNIVMKTNNSGRNLRCGAELGLNYTPFDFIRIGGNIGVTQQVFRAAPNTASYHHWSYPASLYLSVFYKNVSLDYLQKFGGDHINGLYKMGMEKVSYINLSYTYKRLQLGLQCFFPFVKDEFENGTIPESIVYHKTKVHLKRKDRTFAVSLSWNFNAGKQKQPINRSIQNHDSDAGIFKVQ